MTALTSNIAVVKIPDNVYNVPARKYNRAVRQALLYEAFKHGAERLPKHFQAGAHTKYGYKERSAAYNASKRRYRGFAVDLRLTDRSYRYMTSAANQQVVVSGTASGPASVTVKLITRFPFPGGAAPFKPGTGPVGVTVADMVSEVSRFTPDEVAEVSAGVAKRFREYMDLD